MDTYEVLMIENANAGSSRTISNASSGVRFVLVHIFVLLLPIKIMFIQGFPGDENSAYFHPSGHTHINVESHNKSVQYDPRTEISRSITSGEEQYLKSSMLEKIEGDRFDSTHHSWVLRSKSSSLKQKINNSRKTNENEPQDNIAYLPSYVLADMIPLSERHGFNQTSFIDEMTLAHVHNSAESGSFDSAYFMGFFHLYGLTQLPADASKAVDWFNRAAEGGHADAQCALGVILYHGLEEVIGKDRKSAMRWFYRASVDSDHPQGHWLLGRVLYGGTTYEDIGIDYLKGEDKDERLDEAVRLFELAAEGDVPEAIHHLAVMYEYGLITSDEGYTENETNHPSESGFHEVTQKEPNFTKAVQLYKRAANIGWPESSYNLGLMYVYGRGVPLNDILAIDYFRQSASRKHAPSMRYLGILAMNGQGQPHELSNPDEALYWFEQCSILGPIGGNYSATEGASELCREELEELQTVVDLAEAYKKMVLNNVTRHPLT